MFASSTSTRISLVVAFALAACGSETTTLPIGNPPPPPAPALVVYGAGSAAAASLLNDPGQNLTFGPASSLTMKLYALHISANADCSNPVLVQDLGAAGVDKDFMTNPVLFTATPASGTYQCVMFTMSDVLKMKPGTSFGGCVAGTEYAGDIYREGENDWVDVNGNSITGTGTDEVPVDSHVTIFFTRNVAAAQARGISENQLVELQSSLVVPGQSTFRMDASHAVATDGVQCGIEKPVVSFQ
ncbi:MAG: hypothetical protein V4558_09205 [Gemmatimonadota bacterium]